ncbi:MAG: hypothetical protein ACK4S4_15635 [Pyrinomonadaceae bacterium]
MKYPDRLEDYPERSGRIYRVVKCGGGYKVVRDDNEEFGRFSHKTDAQRHADEMTAGKDLWIEHYYDQPKGPKMPVCRECGSGDHLRFDAYAEWSPDLQDYTIVNIFDDIVCDSEECGGAEVEVKWIEYDHPHLDRDGNPK